jgi:hypothetical protein
MATDGTKADWTTSLLTQELHSFAKFFESNLGRATDLRGMHLELIFPRIMEEWRLKTMTQVIKDRVVPRTMNKDTFTPEFMAEVNRRMQETREESIKFLVDGARRTLDELSKSKPEFARWLRALEHAGIMAAWSAFETLAADLWTFAVNSKPDQFATKVLRTFNEGAPEGMSSRSIPIGIAAKYKFDLRHCIGDIISQRIDFTLPSEIRKAYAAAFGLDSTTEGMLDSEDVKQLLLARNLIAHRSGVIDSHYLERAGSAQSVGEELTISEEDFQRFIEAVRKIGTRLLQIVDDALSPVALQGTLSETSNQ